MEPTFRIPLHWLYAVTALIFLFSKVLDGLLRWVFGSVGLAPLIYLPIAASIAVVLIHTTILLSKFRSPLFGAIVMTLMAIFVVIGYALIGVPKQVAMGFYVFIPMFYGAIAYKGFFVEKQHLLSKLALAITALTAFGALLDFFFSLPWAGFSFEVGGQEVTGARAWETYGIERISGFSRASFSLAKQSIIAALLYIAFGKRQWLKIAIWFVSLAVIVLSTTKGILVAWLVLSMIFAVRMIAPYWMLRPIPALIVITGIALPAMSHFMDFSHAFENNIILKIALSSFKSRLIFTWPVAIQMVLDHGSLWIGRGLGGIGAAQIGREFFFSPGDNMYVYLFGIMGLSSLLVYIPWLWTVNRLKPWLSKPDFFMYLFTLLVFTYGITTGVFEDPFIAFFLGLSFTHLFHKRKESHATELQ